MTDSGLERTILPCGIRILSEKMSEARSVSLGVWIDTGSRDEKEEESGFTHFLEHMVFKGTPKMNAREIAWAFDQMGAEANAITGREHTSFFVRVIRDHLEEALEIIFDMIKNPLFLEKDIEPEKQVVLEEIAMHLDSPDELVHDYLAEAIWGKHPLARNILGDAEIIKQANRQKLIEFHVKNYIASRIVVAAAGAIDHEFLCELVEEKASGMNNGKPADRSDIPEFQPGDIIVKKETEQAHIAIGCIGLPRGHTDRFSLAVLDNLLGGSMSSRLWQKIREESGLAYSIYSYTSMLIGTGMVGIYCGTHPSQVKKVIELIEDELSNIGKNGFTEEEINRAKNHIKGSLSISMEDSSNRMNRIAKAELSGGEHLCLDVVLEKIKAVTLEDLARVFSLTWDNGTHALAVIGPIEKQSIPAEDLSMQ